MTCSFFYTTITKIPPLEVCLVVFQIHNAGIGHQEEAAAVAAAALIIRRLLYYDRCGPAQDGGKWLQQPRQALLDSLCHEESFT